MSLLTPKPPTPQDPQMSNPFRIYTVHQPHWPEPVRPWHETVRPVRKRLRPRRRALRILPATLMLLLLICLSAVILWFSPVKDSALGMLGIRQPVPTAATRAVPLAHAYISSPFGLRWGRPHQGIDLAALPGTPIYASSAGTVIHSGWEAGYGKSVVIDHGHGIETRYAHCSKLLVSEGSKVSRGQLIAQVGSTGHSTGPHLHFEVIVHGVHRNPLWYYRIPTDLADAAPNQSGTSNWLDLLSSRLKAWMHGKS